MVAAIPDHRLKVAKAPHFGSWRFGARTRARCRNPQLLVVSSNHNTRPTIPYTVQQTDTLWDIARSHALSVKSIREANGWRNVHNPVIREGQVLQLPPHAQVCTEPARQHHLGETDTQISGVQQVWANALSKLPSPHLLRSHIGHAQQAAWQRLSQISEASTARFRATLNQRGGDFEVPAADDPACAAGARQHAQPDSAPVSNQQAPLLHQQALSQPVTARSLQPAAPAVPADAACRARPTARQDAPDLWAGPRSSVAKLTADTAEQLLLDCVQGAAQRDTLLVVYAPWCKYCQEMEATVEQLASGVQHDPSVQVAKLRGDVPSVRYWARELLQVETFPSIYCFQAAAGKVVKHQGERDVTSLLDFINACQPGTHVRLQPASFHQAAVPGIWARAQSWVPIASHEMRPSTMHAALLAGFLLAACLLKQLVHWVPPIASRNPEASSASSGIKGDRTATATSIQALDASIKQAAAVLAQLLHLRLALTWSQVTARQLHRSDSGSLQPACAELSNILPAPKQADSVSQPSLSKDHA